MNSPSWIWRSESTPISCAFLHWYQTCPDIKAAYFLLDSSPVPHTPQAFTLIRTSLSRSFGRGTVTIENSSGFEYLHSYVSHVADDFLLHGNTNWIGRLLFSAVKLLASRLSSRWTTTSLQELARSVLTWEPSFLWEVRQPWCLTSGRWIGVNWEWIKKPSGEWLIDWLFVWLNDLQVKVNVAGLACFSLS